MSVSVGSSPRAWGIPPQLRAFQYPCRFIPTGVGNTRNDNFFHDVPPVHPHGRGEYALDCDHLRPAVGSSPRAWGIRFCKNKKRCWDRFIPTGVGNTTCLHVLDLPRSVHPHGRGEYTAIITPMARPTGSSPRAWGILPADIRNVSDVRFIPTGVGNTGKCSENRAKFTVHPHGRGEYLIVLPRESLVYGSSPRAWGIQVCAGINMRYNPVHPHGRGEYSSALSIMVKFSGSSPRAWGILLDYYYSTAVSAVHPHGRGEYNKEHLR